MVRLSINSLQFSFVDGGNVQPGSQSVGLGLARPAHQPRLAAAKCLLGFGPRPKCFRAPSEPTKKGLGATWDQKRPYRTSRGSFSRLLFDDGIFMDFQGPRFVAVWVAGWPGGWLAGWLAGWPAAKCFRVLAHTTR